MAKHTGFQRYQRTNPHLPWKHYELKNYNENMYYRKSTPDTKKLPNGGFFEAA